MSSDELQKLISKTIFEHQERMPPGQGFNLYSKGACDMLAANLVTVLEQTFGAPPDGE